MTNPIDGRGSNRRMSAALGVALLTVLSVLASACTPQNMMQSVPEDYVEHATVQGFGKVRYWADEQPGGFVKREQVGSPNSPLKVVVGGGGEDGNADE